MHLCHNLLQVSVVAPHPHAALPPSFCCWQRSIALWAFYGAAFPRALALPLPDSDGRGCSFFAALLGHLLLLLLPPPGATLRLLHILRSLESSAIDCHCRPNLCLLLLRLLLHVWRFRLLGVPRRAYCTPGVVIMRRCGLGSGILTVKAAFGAASAAGGSRRATAIRSSRRRCRPPAAAPCISYCCLRSSTLSRRWASAPPLLAPPRFLLLLLLLAPSCFLPPAMYDPLQPPQLLWLIFSLLNRIVLFLPSRPWQNLEPCTPTRTCAARISSRKKASVASLPAPSKHNIPYQSCGKAISTPPSNHGIQL